MKLVMFLTVAAMLVLPVMGTAESVTDFSVRPGHYDYGYGYWGQYCFLDPSAQIVQAMSSGLGRALDAADGPEKRREIIDKWLKICEFSRTDVLKFRERDVRAREENLKLREEMLRLREDNLRLRTELEKQRMEMSVLRSEIGKLRAAMLQLQEKSAAEQER